MTDLSPVQARIVKALRAHDRAFLLAPTEIGRRMAIVMALPRKKPVVWITDDPTTPAVVKAVRPKLRVRFVSVAEVPLVAPSEVTDGTLVVDSAGHWLDKDSYEALSVQSLAIAAARAWGHDFSVSTDLGLLHKIKHHLGMQISPFDLFDGVLSLGWTHVKPKPPEYDPQPKLKPIDLDELDEACDAPHEKPEGHDSGPWFFRSLGD